MNHKSETVRIRLRGLGSTAIVRNHNFAPQRALDFLDTRPQGTRPVETGQHDADLRGTGLLPWTIRGDGRGLVATEVPESLRC